MEGRREGEGRKEKREGRMEEGRGFIAMFQNVFRESSKQCTCLMLRHYLLFLGQTCTHPWVNFLCVTLLRNSHSHLGVSNFLLSPLFLLTMYISKHFWQYFQPCFVTPLVPNTVFGATTMNPCLARAEMPKGLGKHLRPMRWQCGVMSLSPHYWQQQNRNPHMRKRSQPKRTLQPLCRKSDGKKKERRENRRKREARANHMTQEILLQFWRESLKLKVLMFYV